MPSQRVSQRFPGQRRPHRAPTASGEVPSLVPLLHAVAAEPGIDTSEYELLPRQQRLDTAAKQGDATTMVSDFESSPPPPA